MRHDAREMHWPWCLLLMACLNGCQPSAEDAPSSSQSGPRQERPHASFQWPTNPPPDTHSQEYRLAWNLKTLVEAYESVGSRNPLWDRSAVEALTAFAHLRTSPQVPKTNESQVVQSKTKEAVDAGCKDPMIHYLYVRDHLHTELSADEYGLRFAQAAADLGASDYPPVRKFYAHMRAYKANLDPWKPLEERRRAPYELAWRAMESMVNDRAVPVTEIYDALAEWMDTFRLTQLDEYVRDRIIAPILDTWGATVEAQLLHARFQISYGWRARGGGFAGSVREEAWKLFYDRVRLAETILHQINARAPEDIRAPILMMEVAVDLQYSRADMETWFQKAMRLDPNSYLACTRKLRYLDPKWYGSSADMLAFANECVESTAWGGSVPLIMVDVHEAISRYQTSPAEREAYWKKPRVWKDLQKAFDTFLARNPDASEYRHNYAKYAYLCQQWTVLKEQLKYVLQGKVHYDYFGGREAFEKMVAQSEANQ